MRRYQWNDVTYNETRHLPTLCFEDDLPGGGVRCVCGFCRETIDIPHDIENCPNCANDLIFPRCDW